MHIGVDLDNTVLDATSSYLHFYAKEFADRNIPVILFEQPYNTSVQIDLVYRASNWLEVNRRIHDIERFER